MGNIKELTPDQINESMINNSKLDKIKGAENIILHALNAMKDQGEPNIIQAEDIYPELWMYLLKETIEIVDNMETELAIKVKDIVKRTAISEKTNPILKKSQRPSRDPGDTSLFTTPKYLELNSIFENRDPDEVIDTAIGKCLNNDPNHFYDSDLFKEHLQKTFATDEYVKNDIVDMKTYLCKLEVLRNAIVEGAIYTKDMTNLSDAVSNVLGPYPAIDILYTIFEPDYKMVLYNVIAKNAIINNIIQGQILEQARKEAEAKKVENNIEEAADAVEE